MTETPAAILGEYNLVTIHNASTSSDIEGSAVIGGNLGGATFFNNNSPANPYVYVYGTQSGSLNLNDGGNLYMVKPPGGTVNYNAASGGKPGHQITSGPPLPLSDYTTPLTNLSVQLGTVAANSSIVVPPVNTPNSNEVLFNAVAGANGVAVFSISAAALQADLSGGRSIDFVMGSGVTGVVVNVTGSGTFTDSGNWNGSALTDVLFNFEDVTSVTVGNWNASILAPDADVSIRNGFIAGSVFASSFSGGGELHNELFDGTLPNCCFLRGTALATPQGEMLIEELCVGDLVATRLDGMTAFRPVTWIGSRRLTLSDVGCLPEAYPVRIRAGAFGSQIPHRDLLVTSEHCIFIDGRLIPVRMLVNGASILIDTGITRYEYFHIELEQHAIVIAEGLETESYLDTGNRGNFAEAAAPALYPDFTVQPGHRSWETDAAAPLAVDRETVEPIWRRLSEQAQRIGLTTGQDKIELLAEPDLRLVTDSGLEIRPTLSDGRFHAFVAPAGTRELRLVSRASRPSDVVGPYLDDRRELGVLVGRLGLRHGRRRIAVDAHLSSDPISGWHGLETGSPCRWTSGNALLPLDLERLEDGPVFLDIEVIHAGPYRAAIAA